MANYIIQFSPTGGTGKAAKLLEGCLSGEVTQIDLCQGLQPRQLGPEDRCLVAVPSYGGRVPAVAVERLGKLQGNGAKAVLICVYGNRAWEDTLTELQDTLEGQGFVCVAAVAAVAEHSIFRQFGAGRPDQEDAAQLGQFLPQLRQALEDENPGKLTLEGRHGTYQKYGSVPLKPQGNKNCVACGLCAASCPVGAIDKKEPRKTDKKLCISCMRCVSICPEHARDFSPVLMKPMALAMSGPLGGRKENHLFLPTAPENRA